MVSVLVFEVRAGWLAEGGTDGWTDEARPGDNQSFRYSRAFTRARREKGAPDQTNWLVEPDERRPV